MHTRPLLTSIITSAVAVALATATACKLEITDFNETESESESASATVSESTTTDTTTDTTIDTTTDTTTDATSTGSTTADYPACAEYLADPDNVAGDACAEELGCSSFSQEECQSHFFTDGSGSVECRWGNLYSGPYSQEDPACGGDTQGVCLAATFYGEGGPPCSGHYREIDGAVDILNLNCSTPIAGDFDPCYDLEDEGQPGLCGCMPPLP